MDFETAFVFGEHTEVFGGDLFAYLVALGGIDQGNAGALESGSTETASVDTVGLAHDVVDGYELFATALVVLDGTLAALETELAEEGEVAGFPRGDSLAHALVFAVEVLGTTGEARGHLVLGEVEGFFGDVAQEGLVEALERHTGIGHHVPGSGLALGHAQVVVAVHQATGEPAEDYGQLKLGHAGVATDKAVLLGIGIEEEQGIFFAQGDTGLIEDTVGETDVFALGLTGYLDDFHGGEGDVVGLGKRHDIGDEHSGTGGESANGQASLDDTPDTPGEVEAFLQCVLGTTGVVAPIAFLYLCR